MLDEYWKGPCKGFTKMYSELMKNIATRFASQLFCINSREYTYSHYKLKLYDAEDTNKLTQRYRTSWIFECTQPSPQIFFFKNRYIRKIAKRPQFYLSMPLWRQIGNEQEAAVQSEWELVQTKVPDHQHDDLICLNYMAFYWIWIYSRIFSHANFLIDQMLSTYK